MKIKTIENKNEGVLVFDVNTGEIVYHKKPKKVKFGSFDKYIGIDVKYPNNCITKDSLLESLGVIDGYLSDKVHITSHNILNALNQELLTPQEIKLLMHIIENLTAWNIYIGCVKDLVSCGIPEKNLSRILNNLSGDVLRITHRNKPTRGDIVIHISPIYGWKGDLRYRDSAINKWYGVGEFCE